MLANVVIQSTKSGEAAGWSSALGRWFAKTPLEGIRVLGPAAAPISRLKRVYRYHFVMKAPQRSALQRALRAMLAHADAAGIPRRNLIVDVDAVSLM